MKAKFLLIIVAMLACNVGFSLDIRVMTYNVRYENHADSIHSWKNRKDLVVSVIRSCAPDIFGLQEALLRQVNDIATRMPGYDWVGVGREDGINKGEYAPVFYNSQKFQLKEQGWFWLSETPDVPSKSWDAALPRICTYLLLEDYETHKNFWVFNTHFDHMGVKARKESAKLILKKIRDLNKKDLPVILTGDLNSTPEDDPVRVLKRHLEDSRDISAATPEGPVGTFNGFDINSPLTERIDYIFVSKRVEVKKYMVARDPDNHQYPSDHLPVCIDFSI